MVKYVMYTGPGEFDYGRGMPVLVSKVVKGITEEEYDILRNARQVIDVLGFPRPKGKDFKADLVTEAKP